MPYSQRSPGSNISGALKVAFLHSPMKGVPVTFSNCVIGSLQIL
jgi:hypothetical protein